MKTVTAEQMRSYDEFTMNKIGLSEDVLIEKAAQSVLDALGTQGFDMHKVLVLAGLGNNGADGIALARMLYLKGINVKLQIVGNIHHANQQVLKQLAIAENYGLVRSEQSDFNKATLIIDAIFGIGLDRQLPEGLQKLIEAANRIGKDVLAIDVPTGINATTGEIMGAALNAKTTVTFAYAKEGLVKDNVKHIVGDLIIKDVGIYDPAELYYE